MSSRTRLLPAQQASIMHVFVRAQQAHQSMMHVFVRVVLSSRTMPVPAQRRFVDACVCGGGVGVVVAGGGKRPLSHDTLAFGQLL